MFDRFDTCEAFYLYHMTHHTGQWSKEYALSAVFERIGYRPSPLWKGRPEDLSEGAREVYDRLISGQTVIRDRRGPRRHRRSNTPCSR